MKSIESTKITSIIFLIAGIASLVAALVFLIETTLFINNSIKVEGEIINIEQGGGPSSSAVFPVIQFVDLNGNNIVFKSKYGSSSYQRCGIIGTKVTVRYLPEKPENAEISTFFNLWFPVIILGFMGTGFVFLGYKGLAQ